MTLSCTVIRWIYPDAAKIDIGQTEAHRVHWIATQYRASPNRAHMESRPLPTEHRERSLPAGRGQNIPGSTIARETAPQESPSRTHGLDVVLWMRDITRLTGVHRSTITRWINRGEFPKKDAPHANPSGWLRSTYDRWLSGSSSCQVGARSR